MKPTDDLEDRFIRLRDTLCASDGRKYREFKASLEPHYLRAWTQIALGYLAMILTGIGLYALLPMPWWLALPTATGGAAVIGYAMAFVNLFFHEAAHYNLSASRARNDLLANLFIGLPVGGSIQNYRPIHFGHHRHHGTPMDTERSYFDPLNTRFIVESLFGLRTMRALAYRSTLDREPAAEKPAQSAAQVGRVMMVAGGLFNLLLIAVCVWQGAWPVALAWVGGVFVVFPFLAALRQVLEHRDEFASAESDYRQVPHGRINRLFGDGPLSTTLGGAGFNRHLLHHWEPQVSCTRLKDLEAFLLDTQLGEELRGRQTTYPSIFVRLFSP